MVAVTWQFQAERRALECVADFSICPVQCLQTPATLQPSLPPKTSARCCLSAHPGCGRQMDRDSWLSTFWCSVSAEQAAVQRARLWEPLCALQTLTPCGSPACARCFSGPWKVQTGLEMNVTATMGVNLCWADELKTPTSLLSSVWSSDLFSCFQDRFSFQWQVKAVGWRYLWALYLPFFSAVHGWSQGTDRLITKGSLLQN